MFWRLSLYLLLYIIINGFEAFNSCTGTITFCIQNGYNCYLSCKQERNVTLVKEDGCSSPNVLYTNTTGNLVQINASTSEEAVYSCCKNKNWLCSSTVIVFHEVKDVLCIWDLKNVTVLSCSVAGIPDDNISNKFQMSMNINLMFGDRDYDKPCAAISKFDFTCPFEKSYYDSDIDIYVTMVAKNDVNVTSEKNYQIIPLDNAKYKELIIEVDKVTPETCTLILTLPDDWNLNLEDICFPPCQITIEISYSDSVINYNFIESHNRTTDKRHVPSINMTNLRPNTLHNLSIKWKMIEDAIWSHIATLNFTTKVGVPKTSPLVLNKAIGNQFVGIYIKERSEDCYYGPISLVLNKTTPCVDGPRSRRSLPDSQHLNFSQTVFVKYNDTGNESVTLQYATSAGISSENSEVFFSTPQEVKNVKRLTVIKYNRTHDSLTIDSIDGVDSLHYYWCYGEYLEEKQLVDCKSIGHVVLKDVKKTSYIERRSSNANVNCSNCQLHYGVAIQQLNKTSSILWDSASEPLVDNVYEATGENQYKYLYIAVGILALVFIVFIVCCMNRCYRQAKKVPQPTWPMGKIEIQPYDSINQSYEPEPDLFSVSDSHQTDTTKTLSDSDQSDTFHTFIHTDSSTSGGYSTNNILKDISAQSS